ncbi:glycosyltransferase family 2 protein [Hoeflea ulvae]|uniref:Glycosyltransferase family 2 protein n=1 Tax=Hoeflea ulvae TaxID=2983764 RepID=A0ABT3YKX3_9HYPH|nr:glycosyltransferase family 2 protein [Hoeflea ulvae]MCY0096390.1 glycosyltransferase family 2 protein [Hoeflea ulvae]
MSDAMGLSVTAGGDLEPDAATGGNAWQSTGNDPFFKIRYPLFRQPIVVAFLRSDRDLIDPKAYIDRGSGFREDDAVTFRSGYGFIIIADVGRLGLNRSFRIDPATLPCEFKFTVETFANRADAERAIGLRQARDMGQARRCDLGRLPRFTLSLDFAPRRRSRNRVSAFVDAQYRLAEAAPTAKLPQDDGIWLSTVVPVYNAPRRHLDDLLRSFESQNIAGTELILSDDASTSEETLKWYQDLGARDRVQIVRNPVNGGIARATNAGLAVASGTWVTLLDHDDVVAPHAFKLIANTLASQPEVRFLYTDELVVNDDLAPKGVMLKPAYDPVLLTGMNYINHFSLYRRDRLQAIGNLRLGFDGSQDYDLLLRYLEGLPEGQILHLPYLAYWWRRSGDTYSQRFIDNATVAARTAISERFARAGMAVNLEPALTPTLHRVTFPVDKETCWPKISIIIPNRDKFELISTIIANLYERTDYPDFEVIVIDNGSTDARVLELYAGYERTQPGFRALIRQEQFNFARAINRGVASASGAHYLMLNNDVEVIEADWLKEMVSCLNFDGTGIVGAKLLYPNDVIQHAGVIVGFGGLAGHWYHNKPRDFGGPMNRLHLRNSMTCVTGAVMLISGECARAVGLWDEEHFAVAYNDVDYCLRAHKAGFRIVWTPYACLYHHESLSRGDDKSGERKLRFDQEKANLQRLHATAGFQDPAINPGYQSGQSVPGLQIPEMLSEARPGFRSGSSGKQASGKSRHQNSANIARQQKE